MAVPEGDRFEQVHEHLLPILRHRLPQVVQELRRVRVGRTGERLVVAEPPDGGVERLLPDVVSQSVHHHAALPVVDVPLVLDFDEGHLRDQLAPTTPQVSIELVLEKAPHVLGPYSRSITIIAEYWASVSDRTVDPCIRAPITWCAHH